MNGPRLIVTHIGDTSGFLNGKVIKHEDRNAYVFETWFGVTLNQIVSGSVIIMDTHMSKYQQCWSKKNKFLIQKTYRLTKTCKNT